MTDDVIVLHCATGRVMEFRRQPHGYVHETRTGIEYIITTRYKATDPLWIARYQRRNDTRIWADWTRQLRAVYADLPNGARYYFPGRAPK